MLRLFKPLRSVIKIDEIRIDNLIFRLHYKLTFLLFTVCSILVSAKQFFGDPILCIFDRISVKQDKVLNNYCWIQKTFTLPKTLNSIVGKEVAAQGLGTKYDTFDVKYHKYYQWVCFVLFAQALTFYIPHYMWKAWERNRIKHLVVNLRYSMININAREKHQNILINYLKENFNHHRLYAKRYFTCEFMNFINAIIQAYIIDSFLDNEFSTYGSEVLSFIYRINENRVDPMVRIFPKVTKCIFRKFGPTGNIQEFDGLCVLSLNILNEKIYLVIWFWLIFLISVSAMQIIYRIFICIFPSFRFHILHINNHLCDYEKLKYLNNQLDIGDWFIFRQLSRNINELSFNVIVKEFSTHLKKEEENCEVSLSDLEDAID